MSLEERKKQLSDCSRCTSCRWVPVIKSDRFASICPSIRYGKLHPYSASGKLINGYGLLTGEVEYTEKLIESIYACSMCGGCDVGCKTNLGDIIEPLDSMYALREKVVTDGRAPPAVAALAENLRRHGNPLGIPAKTRGQWCAGLEINLAPDSRVDVLLHVGDAAFEQTQWPQLQFIVETLRNAGVNFAVGGEFEPDSGGLAFDLGHRDLAKSQARATAAWVKSSGARLLVTCSDHAFAAFQGIYPRIDVSLGSVKIMHISQWLNEFIEGNIPSSDHSSASTVVTYHDSCRLGRLSEEYKPWQGQWTVVFNSLPARVPDAPVRFGVGGLYDAPRRLLAAAGATVVEMERIREFSFCCGAGGGGKEAYPQFAAVAGKERLEEALSTGAQTLVTSCTSCAAHLKSTALSYGIPIHVVGLIEYLKSVLSISPNGAASGK